MPQLKDKFVVVIGGATGIGASTARRRAREGAQLVIGDINFSEAQNLAAELTGSGGSVIAIEADQASEESMRAAFEEIAKRFSRLDGAFLNGADTRTETMIKDTDAVTIDLDVWDHVMRTNLRGYLLGARFAIPLMQKCGGGSIVCTSSEFSVTSDGSLPAYGVSKAAINQLVRHVAARFGKENIRCNAIAPGMIQTETALSVITPELMKSFLDSVAFTRLGLPEDIAAFVAYLLSDDGAFINGQVVSVNGGSIFR